MYNNKNHEAYCIFKSKILLKLDPLKLEERPNDSQLIEFGNAKHEHYVGPF